MTGSGIKAHRYYFKTMINKDDLIVHILARKIFGKFVSTESNLTLNVN